MFINKDLTLGSSLGLIPDIVVIFGELFSKESTIYIKINYISKEYKGSY